MVNNSFSIHIETGDIFYNDFNTKENLYNFLLTQQDESKQFIQKEFLITTALKNTHAATSPHFL